MEKIQPILQWLFKNRFWITCGLIAIISAATWYTAWGKIEKERGQWATDLKSKKTSIEGVINSSVEVSSDGKETVDAHPNSKTQEEMEKRNKIAAEAALDAWKVRYDRQKKFLVFAPELPKHIVDVLKKHEPMELPIPEDKVLLKDTYRQTYAEWILKHMPELTKKIKTTWQFPRDKNGVIIKAGSDDSETPRKANLVRWTTANQKLWDSKTSQFKGFNGNDSELPTFEQCLALQQDLWILGGIFDVVAVVNEGYTANDLAPVESIEYILVGGDAVETPRGAIGSVDVKSSSGGASKKGNGPGKQKEKRGYRRAKKTKKGVQFAPGKSKSPFHGYYVNRDFTRLNISDVRKAITSKTLTDQSYLAVAKRIPVRIAVEIDERRINDFLAAAANSPYAFELLQVRVNGVLLANAGFGRVGEKVESTKSGDRDRTQPSAGGGGTSVGDDAPGSGGDGNGDDYIDADGGTFRAELRANFDVRVEFIGIVKVYNPDNRSLFFPEEKEATDNPKVASN